MIRGACTWSKRQSRAGQFAGSPGRHHHRRPSLHSSPHSFFAFPNFPLLFEVFTKPLESFSFQLERFSNPPPPPETLQPWRRRESPSSSSSAPYPSACSRYVPGLAAIKPRRYSSAMTSLPIAPLFPIFPHQYHVQFFPALIALFLLVVVLRVESSFFHCSCRMRTRASTSSELNSTRRLSPNSLPPAPPLDMHKTASLTRISP